MTVKRTHLVLAASVFLAVFYNFSFFRNVWSVYPPTAKNLPFLLSLGFLLPVFIFFVLSNLCYKYTTKPLLILIFLLSAPACFFMDHYNVVIDYQMVQNIFSTDAREAGELISVKLLAYFLVLGILPSIFTTTPAAPTAPNQLMDLRVSQNAAKSIFRKAM